MSDPSAPRTPDFEARVRAAFEAQPFMHTLGAAIGRVEPGLVEITVPARRELGQQHGFVHGGVVATLVDNAAGFAAFSLMAADEQPLSTEFKVNLTAKAQGERLRAVGRVVRDGRVLKVCRTDVYCGSEGDDTLCATSLATIMAVRDTRVRPVAGS